jgi:hypothetical protein
MYKHSLAIGLLAAMSIGSAVSAESYFTCMSPLANDSNLDLGTITSEGPGVVEVFDYRLGEQGELLGTVDVNQGANSDVRLNIGMPPPGDMLAVLTVSGEVVASNVYDVCDE